MDKLPRIALAWPRQLAVVGAAFLVGCVVKTADEDRYEYAAGWRSGKVIEVGQNVTRSRGKSDDCRNDGAVRPPNTKYARIERYHHTSVYWYVVPLPVESNVAVGDLVYVNIRDCEAAVPFRGSSR